MDGVVKIVEEWEARAADWRDGDPMNFPVAMVLVVLIICGTVAVSTRYALRPSSDPSFPGVWRLDRWTGAVATCGRTPACVTYRDLPGTPSN